MRAELVVDCKKHHGKGILWNLADGRVCWTDIKGRALWYHNPCSFENQTSPMKDRVCCLVLRSKSRLIVAFDYD